MIGNFMNLKNKRYTTDVYNSLNKKQFKYKQFIKTYLKYDNKINL